MNYGFLHTDGKVTFKGDISNCGGEERVLKLIAASYENGRLVGAATNEVAVESNGYIEDITLETASGDIAKVFLWTDEMKPVDMVCDLSDSV